jgi:hypothetical protein
LEEVNEFVDSHVEGRKQLFKDSIVLVGAAGPLVHPQSANGADTQAHSCSGEARPLQPRAFFAEAWRPCSKCVQQRTVGRVCLGCGPQVKGWCYYESRVLGAHHGLISTYALETLVLYVLNRYHRTLKSPLQVRPDVSSMRCHGP